MHIEIKIKYINYSFKKLGTIDITNFKNIINNLSDDNWDENTSRNRGKTHEEVKVIAIKWIPEVLKQKEKDHINFNKINKFYFHNEIKSDPYHQKLEIIRKNQPPREAPEI